MGFYSTLLGGSLKQVILSIDIRCTRENVGGQAIGMPSISSIHPIRPAKKEREGGKGGDFKMIETSSTYIFGNNPVNTHVIKSFF